MKPEPNTQQKAGLSSSQRSPAKSLMPHPQIQSGSQSIGSRKCTVLDLLFDREVCVSFLQLPVTNYGFRSSLL